MTVLDGLDHWAQWLGNCMHSCVGSVLRYHGVDPVPVFGAHWEFHYRPGDARPDEYYHPERAGDLLGTLAPHHAIRSAWHEPPDDESAWEEVRAEVDAGRPPVVAVDNFHLPFRPAYGDVHANHLVVVYGHADGGETVHVLDSSPPGHRGPMPYADLRRARRSENPREHERDTFFAGSPIRNRWLGIEVCGPPPEIDEAWVRRVLAANVEGFRTAGEPGELAGVAGLGRCLDLSIAGLQGPDPVAAIDELYVLVGAELGSIGSHARFLTETGGRHGWWPLVELGRDVARVGHHWTALRPLVGLHRSRPGEVIPRLRRRWAELLIDQQAVLDRTELALEQEW
jgi:hypothetical protein